MLNELYSIHKGLEAAKADVIIKHNDIHSPGMGITFRVMLNEDGQVISVSLMTDEQIQNSWSLGNGYKNQFPAVKVTEPLLAEGHADYRAWKKEPGKRSEADYRELIQDLSQKYPQNLSEIDCWPSYRKKVLERKEQLAGSDDSGAVYALFDRYSRTETGVKILDQVTNILKTSAQLGADMQSLKAICTLLFGDDVMPNGKIKDGERVTLLLDCFPQADIDIYASSRDRVPELSHALFASDSKSNKKTRIAVCALSGKETEVVQGTFPREKLNAVGGIFLFAKNAKTSGPTVKRYDSSGSEAFSVSDKLSQQLAASIAFINEPKFKDKTWSKLPPILGTSPSLLLAYCKDDWELPLTPLITGASDIEDFDDYLDATESVLDSFKGKNLSLDTVVNFTEIIVLDKANRKINFSTTANVRELTHAAEQWQKACQNSPDFKLLALLRTKERKICSPWAISPRQVMYLSQQKYIQDGSRATSLPGISFADVMKLFLGRDNQVLAKRCIQRFAEQYQPLFNYCALSRLQWVLQTKARVKTNAVNNARSLSAVTLITLLLFKIKRTKEIYMKDFAFQLGQLCSAMDELHIGFCKSERDGDIPSILLGNQIYGMALQDPNKAMAVLASRRKPYDSWVKRIMVKSPRAEDKAIIAAIYAQRWMRQQALSISELLPNSNLSKSDTYKAELMLGYLAGRPFEQSKKPIESTNSQGENQ